MKYTLGEIARYLSGELEGNPETEIIGVNSLQDAREGDITFLASRKNRKLLEASQATAVVVDLEEKVLRPHIRTNNPYLAFAKLLELFYPPEKREPSIHPGASMGEDVKLGEGVVIYPHSFIGDGASIGARSVIYPYVYVGRRAVIGDDTVVYPNVTLYDGIRIGNRVIIHGGAVVGADGFGFVRADDGTHRKIPQVGTVEIEDDVEIGANVCIDRANLGKTLIRRGVKIDNLTQVAHNTAIGEDSIILAQVGLSGSCRIGRNVTMAGQVGVIDHIEIGDNAVIIPQSGIVDDVPPNAFHTGSPNIDHSRWKRINSVFLKLPELAKRVRNLERRLEEMGKEIKRPGGDS